MLFVGAQFPQKMHRIVRLDLPSDRTSNLQQFQKFLIRGFPSHGPKIVADLYEVVAYVDYLVLAVVLAQLPALHGDVVAHSAFLVPKESNL